MFSNLMVMASSVSEIDFDRLPFISTFLLFLSSWFIYLLAGVRRKIFVVWKRDAGSTSSQTFVSQKIVFPSVLRLGRRKYVKNKHFNVSSLGFHEFTVQENKGFGWLKSLGSLFHAKKMVMKDGWNWIFQRIYSTDPRIVICILHSPQKSIPSSFNPNLTFRRAGIKRSFSRFGPGRLTGRL